MVSEATAQCSCIISMYSHNSQLSANNFAYGVCLLPTSQFLYFQFSIIINVFWCTSTSGLVMDNYFASSSTTVTTSYYSQ